MSDRHAIVCAAYLILLRGGREVLLIERKNSGWMDGWYTFPAGHVEPHESPAACAMRETKEEIGVGVEEKDLSLVHVLSRLHHDPDRIDFYFATEKWRGNPLSMEPDKCGDPTWFPIHHLPDNLIPSLRQVLDCYQKGILYSELEYEEK